MEIFQLEEATEFFYFAEAKKAPPTSDAKRQAQSMGLEYYGFGRWGRDKQVTHLAYRGTLVPFHSPVAISKSKDWKGKERITVDQNEDKPSSKLVHKDQIRFTDKTFKDHNKKAIQNLKPEEENALGQLLGGQLDKANMTLRRGQNIRKPEHSDSLAILDKALEKFEIPMQITIYRPTGKTDYKKGHDYEFKGFVKGTIDPEKIESHHMLAIEVPKGYKGVYNDNESKEFILPKNTTIRILSDPIAINPPVEDKYGKPSSATLLFKAMVVDNPITKLKGNEKPKKDTKKSS